MMAFKKEYTVKQGDNWAGLGKKAKALNPTVKTLVKGQKIYVPKEDKYGPAPVIPAPVVPAPVSGLSTAVAGVSGAQVLTPSQITPEALFNQGLGKFVNYVGEQSGFTVPPPPKLSGGVSSAQVAQYSTPVGNTPLTGQFTPAGLPTGQFTPVSEQDRKTQYAPRGTQDASNPLYLAESKARTFREIQRQAELTGSINTDLMFTTINAQEMQFAGLGYEQIESFGGVYNKYTGEWEMPSTAPGSKLRPGQAVIQALESLETTLKVDPTLLPQYIYDDEASLYDFKGKDLKKLGGIYYPSKDGNPGFWYFPNSSQQAAPTNVQPGAPSGSSSGTTKKVYKGGGGGGSAVSSPAVSFPAPVLSEDELSYFEKLLIGDVETSKAIADLELFINSERLSPEQLQRARTKLDDLRVMQTSSGSISNVWRIG